MYVNLQVMEAIKIYICIICKYNAVFVLYQLDHVFAWCF